MNRPEKLEIKWEIAKGYKDSWNKFAKIYPEIRSSIAVFNECKREIPSRRLPAKMHDHKLDGGLKGFMDCHLADDVILIYKPKANGVVRLFLLCEHKDLKGSKAKDLLKRLK